MRPLTDDEILTNYIKDYDDGSKELREAMRDTTGFKFYALGVRRKELKQAIEEAYNKLLLG